MKPYHAGQKAFYKPKFKKGKNGHLIAEGNPYRAGTKDHLDWETGYNKAYFEQLERIGG